MTPAIFLKQYRESLSMTQEQLAERLNVSRGFIARIENGYANLTSPLIQKIKQDLGIFVDLSLLLNIKHKFTLQSIEGKDDF